MLKSKNQAQRPQKASKNEEMSGGCFCRMLGKKKSGEKYSRAFFLRLLVKFLSFSKVSLETVKKMRYDKRQYFYSES